MSKKGEFRQFHVNFWQATAVEDLDPTEKLLYIYFITSPRSNMEGVYKTTIRRIAFETGIDRDMVVKIAGRFAELRIGGIARDKSSDVWIIVAHSPEFMTASPSIQTYFSENIGKVPIEVVKFMNHVGYRWPTWAEKPTDEASERQGVHTPYTPPTQGVDTVGTHVSDTHTDTHTDTKTNTDTNTSHAPEPSAPATGKQLSPLKDEIADTYQSRLTEITPASTWKSIPQERKQLNKLGDLTRKLSDETDIPASDLVPMVLSVYAELKKRNRQEFWSGAPFTASALVTRWDAIVEAMRKRVNEKQEAKEHMYVPEF